ncbi:unnamed protein product [Phaedon cochleariae]|uniref:Double jelly roll-like domain-containing protein n=1 Tax=Phaedon cochleariae TaxID=80249 RepID=A0A9N9X3K3_PHACE|nr:unnamed protein product [Phaedon cochleariae]
MTKEDLEGSNRNEIEVFCETCKDEVSASSSYSKSESSDHSDDEHYVSIVSTEPSREDIRSEYKKKKRRRKYQHPNLNTKLTNLTMMIQTRRITKNEENKIKVTETPTLKIIQSIEKGTQTRNDKLYKVKDIRCKRKRRKIRQSRKINSFEVEILNDDNIQPNEKTQLPTLSQETDIYSVDIVDNVSHNENQRQPSDEESHPDNGLKTNIVECSVGQHDDLNNQEEITTRSCNETSSIDEETHMHRDKILIIGDHWDAPSSSATDLPAEGPKDQPMETVSVDEETPADVDRQPPAEPSHADEETLTELDDETLTEDNVNSPLAESAEMPLTRDQLNEVRNAADVSIKQLCQDQAFIKTLVDSVSTGVANLLSEKLDLFKKEVDDLKADMVNMERKHKEEIQKLNNKLLNVSSPSDGDSRDHESSHALEIISEIHEIKKRESNILIFGIPENCTNLPETVNGIIRTIVPAYNDTGSKILRLDHSLMSLHEHTYKPYGSPSFKNSDEIRIAVSFQDLILDISESYIYIEGKFTPNDATKTCYLSNNALAFLFDEIRYEMGGEQVCMVRKPGITTTMKSMISYGESNMKFLETIGWGLDGGKQVLLDEASNVFSGKLPLTYLMGFAEDYCRGILNIKQELILIIARSFKNSYIGEVDADVEINKIEWKIRHVMPSDKQKLKLLTRLNRSSTAKVKIAYRMWDLYELPTIRETPSDICAVKTTNSLERPRYIIIGFQNTDNTDNRSEDITQFTHAGVSNIRLYLNSEVYPYERWNLDFDKKLDAVAYYAYDNFQRSYYGKDMSEPMMSIEEFRKNPLFIIDCNHQPDAMKSSTVDIKITGKTGWVSVKQPGFAYSTVLVCTLSGGILETARLRAN